MSIFWAGPPSLGPHSSRKEGDSDYLNLRNYQLLPQFSQGRGFPPAKNESVWISLSGGSIVNILVYCGRCCHDRGTVILQRRVCAHSALFAGVEEHSIPITGNLEGGFLEKELFSLLVHCGHFHLIKESPCNLAGVVMYMFLLKCVWCWLPLFNGLIMLINWGYVRANVSSTWTTETMCT